MVNAWSLLYDELYGDDEMTEDNKITPQESDEYDPKPKSDSEDSDWNDPIITSANLNDTINIDVPNFDSFTLTDDCYIGLGTAAYPTASYIDPTNYSEVSIDTSNFDTVQFNMPDTPTPGIETDNHRKYNTPETKTLMRLQDRKSVV